MAPSMVRHKGSQKRSARCSARQACRWTCGRRIGPADVGAYGAVVLGSAVYIGQWRKLAAKFLQTNEEALTGKPVWLFSSGPTGEGDPVELAQGWRFPGKLQPIADNIGARDIALFHGSADASKMNFLEKWMLKNVKAPAGDYRDWDAIIAWSEAIAEVLREGATL